LARIAQGIMKEVTDRERERRRERERGEKEKMHVEAESAVDSGGVRIEVN
jgi:hypothetical protein